MKECLQCRKLEAFIVFSLICTFYFFVCEAKESIKVKPIEENFALLKNKEVLNDDSITFNSDPIHHDKIDEVHKKESRPKVSPKPLSSNSNLKPTRPIYRPKLEDEKKELNDQKTIHYQDYPEALKTEDPLSIKIQPKLEIGEPPIETRSNRLIKKQPAKENLRENIKTKFDFPNEEVIGTEAKGQENDSDSSKYDNSILRSIYSSACQRKSNFLSFKKCLPVDGSSSNYVQKERNRDKKVNSDISGFIKIDNEGQIVKDELIIVSDDYYDEDNENEEIGDEYDPGSEEWYRLDESKLYGPGLPDCSERQQERIPVLIVSTLDGQITGLNHETGAVLWSHPTGTNEGPMLSSSMSKIEVTSRGEWVRLIPSLDGGIYRFDGENVEALPITADTLLHSSYKFNEDTMFSGGKVSEILGIFPHSGEIKYACDNSGCPRKQSTANANQILIVKRVSQVVRAIDPKSGSERWNFSVGHHEVNIANTGCESLLDSSELELSLPSLHFVLPDGLVAAMDEDSQVVWQQKLPSPIVSAWSLIKGDLEQIDLFSSSSIPALVPDDADDGADQDAKRQPALYVGIHQRQLYIQQNNNFQKELNSVLQRYIKGVAGGGAENTFPRVRWQPYLATAVSRTPAIHHEAKDHPLLLDYEKKQSTNDLVVRHKFDYPYDNGFYLYGDDENAIFNESDFWSNSGNLDRDAIEEPRTISSRVYSICFEIGPNIWWKLAIVFTLFGSLNLMLRHLINRNVEAIETRIGRRNFLVIAMLLHNIFREHPQVLAIIHRMGLRVPPLPAPPPREGGADHENAFHESPQRQDSNFSSRYTSDFEPIRCLGKGGFGVVFHVKNKLDENEYAVKRILLPSKESSAERVKREVRALAKLNHPNIVRYYNSWLETPPVGWEKQADDWWRNSEAISNSLLSLETEDTGSVFPSLEHRNRSLERNPDVDKNEESLIGVVNKLGHNLNLVVPTKNKNSLEVSKDKEGDKGTYSSGSFSSSDNDSVSGYNEDDEQESDSSEDGAKDPISNASFPGDDSFEVVFENSSSNSVSSITKDEKSNNDENSIIFAESSNLENNYIDPMILTQNDYSKLTCFTRSPFRSNSVSSFVKKGLKRPQRTKSSSFSLGSSQEKYKLRDRRRIKSQNETRDMSQRPSFLDLTSHNSKKTGSKGSPFLSSEKGAAPIVSTPSPRTYLYIQMELCQKESLKDWLSTNQTRNKEFLCSIFNDIVLAVEYVHDRCLMHRDLKPSNIFFSLDGEIKIGDFGLVTTIEEENDTITPVVDVGTNFTNDNIPSKQRTLNAGTHLYMSPEQMEGHPYTYKVDIYSLGLIFFEMLVPFSTEMERRTVMLRARNKDFPAGFTSEYPDVAKLLQLTLHRNPNERPTTRGIRARQPLDSMQKGDIISPEEHFHLTRTKSHSRSHSGSFSGIFSSSSNS